MTIPEKVKYILLRLESGGFEAYAVGGCIRDSLLGKVPKDWDVCTSALPESVKAVFSGEKIIETGIKHGTVTLLLGGEAFEITTFRTDGEYLDCRRPENVSFTPNLTEDLARRDFTINAMAYGLGKGLVDPFGGRNDLSEGIIRAVGDPRLRFSEDALRILRALRFAVTTGFEIEPETAAAMLERRALLGKISAERKRDELLKTLAGGQIRPCFTRFREIVAEVIPELRPCFDFEQNTIHHCHDVYTHILTAVDSCGENDPTLKVALLLHDIAKPACRKFYDGSDHFKGHPAAGTKIAKVVLDDLKFPKAQERDIVSLIRFHDIRFTKGAAQVLKVMSLLGDRLTGMLFPMMYADTAAQSDYRRAEKLGLIDAAKSNYAAALEQNMCHSLSDLAIRGSDIGFNDRRCRAALHLALNAVMNGKVKNDKQALLEYVNKVTRNW